MSLIPLKKHVQYTDINEVSFRYHEINHNQRKISPNYFEILENSYVKVCGYSNVG